MTSNRSVKLILAALAATTLLGSVGQASAVYRRPGGGHFGGYGHHRGVGVGAAVGLGILGAAAAGVAASQYNGYPAYSDGRHRGYGYDYYPDHGYYGPY